ncbi:MAG: hypothetical protein COV65_01650, partial [Nitrosopumilales archaeon CG11_big_fil_rev_8_21_14_0_20_33_24]
TPLIGTPKYRPAQIDIAYFSLLLTLVIICWCGHADKYHSTATPNKCTKCQECQYFRPRGNPTSVSSKPIMARFDGICKVCKSDIKAGQHQIIRNSNNIWIHYLCDKTT